ncbi:hypothetical protein BDR26DRAFT_898214 [Obelidium mucronatum]|nr:hypothetical protein BDR26DRAFT_898214 [Obelidium mucronatum]
MFTKIAEDIRNSNTQQQQQQQQQSSQQQLHQQSVQQSIQQQQQQEDKERFLREVERAQPIVITQVYNPGMLALNFDDVLSNVLEFNDLITIAYMDEKTLGILPNSRENSIYEKSNTNNTPSTPPPPVPIRQSTINTSPTFNDSLQSLVSNSLSLTHLLQFALSEYSVEHLLLHLDIESLQTCTEDAAVIDYCRYIYLMYFGATAPIPIIISGDLRKEIAGKIGNMDDLDVTIYDSIQEQVLATVQTFLHPRFLKSPGYQALDQERRNDPKKFREAQISSFSKTYPNDLKTLKKVTEILQNPHNAANLLASLNNNVPVPTESIREFLLTKTGARYIPGLTATATSGYFDNTVRKRWAVKQRRILKEKKLNKFFGQRVGEDEMKGQRIALGAVALRDGVIEVPSSPSGASGSGGAAAGGTLGRESKIGKSGVTEIKIEDILKAIEDLEEDVEGGAAGDAATRRKKIEKLRNIFGDQIPTLAPTTPNYKNSSSKSSTESVNINNNNNNQEEAPIVVDTINELTADERRLLNRRNKKLTEMLGQAVDAKLVGVNEVKGVSNNSGPGRKVSTACQNGPMLGMVEAPTPEASMCQAEPKHSPIRSSPLDPSNYTPTAELLTAMEPDLDEVLSTSSIGAGGAGVDDSCSSSNELLADEALVSKEARKKRLDKLSKVFGQRMQSHNVIAEANKMIKIQSFAQKVEVRKKSSKIEARMGHNLTAAEKASVAMKVKKNVVQETDILKELQDEEDQVGQTPAADEAGERLFQFVTSLGSTIQNTIEVDDFLDLVSVIAGEITGKGQVEVDEDMDPDYIRAAKSKRITKLKKFFKMSGVTIYDYIDTQIIRVLELQIRILVSDQTELDVLKEEIVTLRGILNGRSPDFQGQISGLRQPSFSAASARNSVNSSAAAYGSARTSDSNYRTSTSVPQERSRHGSSSQLSSLQETSEKAASPLMAKFASLTGGGSK